MRCRGNGNWNAWSVGSALLMLLLSGVVWAQEKQEPKSNPEPTKVEIDMPSLGDRLTDAQVAEFAALALKTPLPLLRDSILWHFAEESPIDVLALALVLSG